MKNYFLCALAIICLATAVVGCRTKFIGKVGEKPSILVSIPPYISVIKAIAGDTVEVNSAVPAGFDPHTNEITPRQAEMIQNCDLWLGVGEEYEKKLLSALRQAKHEVRVLQLNETVDLLSFSENANFVDACTDIDLPEPSTKDIHFWMSPIRLLSQAHYVYQALAAMMPQNAELYAKNLDTYTKQLKDLNKEITEQLHPIRGKGVLVSHPFLGYLCHDYHLYQITVECEGKSPRTQSVNRVLTLAKNYEVSCVFTTPQHSNKGALLVAEKLSLKTYQIDPMAINPLDTIKQVVDDITKTD